ncbi:MAG: indole-3-glycerol phosphate synthase TrpC [Deltaproteobacteria bacterium]|nr:indole-3-glycerol phosphate synthase TrpC [Deltaproteobacteria bacterium]MBW2068486.1 indole-3-glycerol phosphate synthase TrpC [Deltaproteobacteria bacterium]
MDKRGKIPGQLRPIIEAKLNELQVERKRVSFQAIRRLAEERAKEWDGRFHFRDALAEGTTPRIIAEIKRGSPSKGLFSPDLNPEKQARIYEKAGAAAISVITEKNFFFAAENDFEKVKASTFLPVLRKDFILDPYQIFQSKVMGSDAVLLIVRILEPDQLFDFVETAHSLGMSTLVEVHNKRELDHALEAQCSVIGINNRDLDTFEVSLTRTEDLAGYIDMDKHVVVCESGITGPDDIRRIMKTGVRAFLIGEHLVKSEDPALTLKTLLEAGRNGGK